MKILASDFDNTIYFPDNDELTKDNIESIKKFITKGNIFCVITGRNYTELLQEKRLTQAAWLLRNTDRKVDEIAAAVGYENISYFHRLFAARFGLSPKKYRDCK